MSRLQDGKVPREDGPSNGRHQLRASKDAAIHTPQIGLNELCPKSRFASRFLCASVVDFAKKSINHRDTEAQSRASPVTSRAKPG